MIFATSKKRYYYYACFLFVVILSTLLSRAFSLLSASSVRHPKVTTIAPPANELYHVISRTTTTTRPQQRRRQVSSSIDSSEIHAHLTDDTGITDDTTMQQQLLQDENELDWFRFASIDELYAPVHPHEDILADLKESKVAIVGLGSVGSFAAEALCRSGIGHFVLIDLEDICVSQTASVLHSLTNNVGELKTEAMKERLLEIHPSVQVDIVNDFVMDDNVEEIVAGRLSGVDVAIDCIQGVHEKIHFWKSCQQRGISCLTSGNPSGKIDPTKVKCRPLKEFVGANEFEEILSASAKELADKGDVELLDTISCVFSDEIPTRTTFGHTAEGTVCFVSGSMGLVVASESISILLNRKESAKTSRTDS